MSISPGEGHEERVFGSPLRFSARARPPMASPYPTWRAYREGGEGSRGPGPAAAREAGRTRLVAEAGRADGERSCSPTPLAPPTLGAPLSQGQRPPWAACLPLGPFPLLQALSSLSSPDLPHEAELSHLLRQGPRSGHPLARGPRAGAVVSYVFICRV